MKIQLKFRIFINIIAYLILSCLIYANAQGGILDYFESKELIVIIGETKPLRVSNPRQVKIGNPDLLDVVGAGRKELLLSGLAEGETILTVVDDLGQHKYTVKIFQEDLEKVKERIDILLEAAGFSQLTTRIGDKERKIFILGEVPTFKKDSFESKIESVKDKIINLVEYYEDTPSVAIDVEVLEIKTDDLEEVGFTWNQTVTFSEPSANVPSNFPVDNLLQPKHVLQILKDWRTTQLVATLDLLKQNNKARTLSRPKIVCMSGKEAKLLVGGEVPIITSATTTSGTGAISTEDVELKEYGIILNITPVVNEDDNIQVGLNVEITEIDTTTERTLSTGSTTPGFKQRSAQTELSVSSGQTVFLAGMIKSYDKDNRAQVPFLGSIPFFGALFRQKDLQLEETEIVISLTPTVIRNQSPGRISSVTKVSTTPAISLKDIAKESVKKRPHKEDDPAVNYSALIQDIINSNIKYPRELRDEEVEGTVKLSLHLLSTGELSGVIIMQSSGNQLLDESAEYAVRRLSPFPAFPLEVKLKELWIDIPIVYKAGNRT
ncbi:MAG: TonB family protein [Candidatus Omnitrophica bacterium]|nr:TonB family protein [Candidatus Omnitrophota bacterium]